MPPRIDLTGRTFGRLSVIARDSLTSYGQSKWLCLCVCGEQKRVFGNALTTGVTQSCGCLHRELNVSYGNGTGRKRRCLRMKGRSLTIAEWCQELGLNEHTVRNRLASGLSTAEALSRPVQRRRSR